MNDGECPFRKEKDVGINHLFNQCEMAKTIWTNINTYCHTHYNSSLCVLDRAYTDQ